MKIYLIIICNLFLISILYTNCYSQKYNFDSISPPPSTNISGGELIVYNQTYWYQPDSEYYEIKVKIIPAGFFFNGAMKYSPFGIHLINQNPTPLITGCELIIQPNTNSSDTGCYKIGNFDQTGSGGSSNFAYGYGLYKISFFKRNISNNEIWDFIDSTYIDWRDELVDNIGYNNTFDIRIDYFSEDVITFRHYPHNTEYPYYYNHIIEVDRHIKMWELHGSFLQAFEHRLGLFSPDNSNINFLNWPIIATDYQNPVLGHENPGDIALNLKIDNSFIQNIKINPNQNLTFKNGASLVARNVTFNTYSPGTTWNGFKLENSGYDTIVNCTFNNAKTSVSITDNILSNHPSKIIRKNTFNISQENGRGLDLRNQNKILIDSNTFNFSNSNSTVGIFFRNSEPPNAGASQSFYYNLNIVNNKFYNGYLPVYISGLTSSRTPFYVFNNSFTGNNIYSITGLKITGDIKNNRFDVNNISRSIGLWNSNPNVYGNSFKSVSTNMYLNYSFPALGPYQNSSDQLVWAGGRNSFNSTEKENIYLAVSYPYINNGGNIFTANDNYHIFGSMPDSVNDYYITNNCWDGYNEIPKYLLYKYINDTTIQNISAHFMPVFCDEGLTTASEIYTDKGSGIIDTILITDDFDSDPLSGDESLLDQARTSNGIKDFPDAIINYKGLINNFSGSELIYTSLYEMYDIYSALDTSADQMETDVLFGDLKQYLQSKISAEIYGNDFNSIAYDIILMCETRMRNLEIALTGYEFIALYHPNAEQRMLASWDYEEIEEMINGSGGGEKKFGIRNEELGIQELEINELLRLDKLIEDDPLMKILKKNYEKNNAVERNIKSDKVSENKLYKRAKENIFKAKFLQKEEKEKRYMEDLKLLMTTGNTDAKESENIIFNPKEFILNQNYPNPFNPSTNISYSIPVSSFVTLKVFDITGKAIVTLVNEYKQNGSYQVTFNGINLSSGIYYFHISAGDWSQVRKMMLIK